MNAVILIVLIIIVLLVVEQACKTPEQKEDDRIAWAVEALTNQIYDDYPAMDYMDPEHPKKPDAREVFIPAKHYAQYAYHFYAQSYITLSPANAELTKQGYSHMLERSGVIVPCSITDI
uniref:Uncharacterized protein n=1 Tax=Pseudomonas phage RVTF4 TaxID=3236931 RepID=A0AB39CCV3_9VIRU